MMPSSNFRTKILKKSDSLEEYAIYKAALEWDVVEPIVIDSKADVQSEKKWRDLVEPYHHQITNLITFCRRLPVTLLSDDVGLGKTISAGLIASELISRNRISKILIICPKILRDQWKEELETKFNIPAVVIKNGEHFIIDTYSRVAIVKLYDQKTALTAADAMNDRIIPFFESHDIPLLRVLTDRGTEYCGKVEHHPFELYLATENVDHTKTKANSPQTNGICERFHKTMKDECYNILFRKKIYSDLKTLQEDVDNWLRTYNELRPHSGKYCYGKTPYQTFLDSKKIAKEKNLSNLFDNKSNNFDNEISVINSIENH